MYHIDCNGTYMTFKSLIEARRWAIGERMDTAVFRNGKVIGWVHADGNGRLRWEDAKTETISSWNPVMGTYSHTAIPNVNVLRKDGTLGERI